MWQFFFLIVSILATIAILAFIFAPPCTIYFCTKDGKRWRVITITPFDTLWQEMKNEDDTD